MNKKVLTLLLMSIWVVVTSACGNKNNINISKNDTGTKIEEKAEIKTEEKAETKIEEKLETKGENKENTPSRYYVAGIDNAIEFEKVFNTVKALVDKGEKEKPLESRIAAPTYKRKRREVIMNIY